MLNGKQKRYLRSLAVNEKAIFQIGKDGIVENTCVSILDALKARELVKISVLKTCDDDIKEIASIICDNTKSELVQIIGKSIVLYKPSKEHLIILP